MKLLRKIIISIIPFAVEMGIKKSQAPKNIALKVTSGVLLLVGAIFGLIALHQYLATQHQPIIVNLIYCGGFILTALTLLTSAIVREKKYEREHSGLLSNAKKAITNTNLSELPTNLKNSAQTSIETISRTSNNLRTDLRQHPSKYLLAAAVIGLIWGARTRGKARRQS